MNQQANRGTQSTPTGIDRSDDARCKTPCDCSERALRFQCEGEDLIGILHVPAQKVKAAVLVVVGGPQYRVGSHRQFVQLARALAGHGVAVLRFDCRGMGDGEGSQRDFEDIQLDIRAAMDTLCLECPNVREVTIWGLCDGASAACFYAASDPRVKRLVLLNPWVRTTQGEARAYIAQYYLERILSRNFWTKLLRGEVRLFAAVADFARKLFHALLGADANTAASMKPGAKTPSNKGGTNSSEPTPAPRPEPKPEPTRKAGDNLPDRMATGLEAFTGKVLYLLSGRDLTAQEFRDVSRSSKRWRNLMDAPRCSLVEFPEADHTFSGPAQSAAASQATLDFLINE